MDQEKVFRHKPYGPYEKYFKRPLDLSFSLLALIVLSPLLLVLTIIGAIAMKGNPFFVQRRPGRIDPKTGHEKVFSLIKFRTMSNAKGENRKLLPDKERLNKYGKFLRSTSFDELPELLNIVAGQLAICGPRPLLTRYLPYYTEEERHRHDVRPGLTGLAQVHGRNACCWQKRFEYDLSYVNHVSFKQDVFIIILSIKKVLTHEDILIHEDNPVKALDVERSEGRRN